MAEITSLSSQLSEIVKDVNIDSLRCRSVVLLVTKWDRVHIFDGVQGVEESATDFIARIETEERRHQELFEQWLESPRAG